MNAFQDFQDALEETFPSLSFFSDLDWDTITQEYIGTHESAPQDIEEFVFGFPLFLQDKAAREECPPYLFELAYFELMESELLNSELDVPVSSGYHLNPTLRFLSFEFDISQMMEEAIEGNHQIISRPHVLCLYHHPENGPQQTDMKPEHLETLQRLEDGPIGLSIDLTQSEKEVFNELIDLGLILKIV